MVVDIFVFFLCGKHSSFFKMLQTHTIKMFYFIVAIGTVTALVISEMSEWCVVEIT
jgi:hypothetical protein